MKATKRVIGLVFIWASAQLISAQPLDAEGCKDHPLFNRMTNFVIESCVTNYNAVDFQIGSGSQTKNEEGNITTLRYSFNTESNTKMPSPLQIIKNYENAIIAKGGKKVYQGVDDIDGGPTGAVFNFSTKDKEYWITVRGMYEPQITGEVGAFTLIVLEKEAMNQEIVANNMLTELKKNGFMALYINFETGKASIKAESQNIIDEMVKMLNSDPTLKISIEGHTDNVGKESANQTLSEQRAKAVMDALITKGIDKSRLVSKGWGQTKPVADNGTEDGKAKNRRVEIVKL